MRVRLSALLLVLLVLVLLGVVFSRPLTGQDYLKEFFLRQIEHNVGRKIDVGHVKLVVFPRVRLELSQVVVHDRDPTHILLTARRVDMVLRLIPLLRRQVVGKRLLIEDPQVTLRRDQNGRWNILAEAQAQSAQDESALRALAQMLRIREAALLNGTVTILDDSRPGGTRRLQLKTVDATLSIPPGRTRADVHLAATLPGQEGVSAVSVTGVVAGAEAPATLAAEEPVAARTSLLFEGRIEAANLHLRELADFFGPRPVPEGLTGAANLRGALRIVPGVTGYDVLLSDITANVDRFALSGRANLSGLLTAQPTFSVTLSSSTIDLNDLLSHVPPQWIHAELQPVIAERQIGGVVEVVTATLTGSAAAATSVSLTGEFRVQQGRALIGQDRVPARDLAATVLVEAGRVRVLGLTGQYGDIRITQGKAMVSFLEAGPWLEMELSGSMEAADLVRLLAKSIRSDRVSAFLAGSRDVTGEALPTFRLVGPLNQPGGVTFVGGEIIARNIGLTSPSLPERISDLQGRLLLSESGTQLDQVNGRLGEMFFQLHGTITGGAISAFDGFVVRARSDAAFLARLLPAGVISDSSLQGPLIAAVALSGSTATPQLRGHVVLDEAKWVIPGLGEKPPGAPAALEFDGNLASGNVFTVTKLELVLPPLRLATKGKIQLGKRFAMDVSLATGTVSLSSLPEWLSTAGIEAGKLEVSLDIKGSNPDWRTWRINGWLALTNGLMLAKGLDGHVQDLYVRLKLIRNSAELKRLAFRIGDSDLAVSGTIKNWAHKPLVTAKIESSHLDIDLLIPKGARSPIRDLLETLAAASRVNATATIDRGVYKKLRFGGLSCRITIEDGILDVDRIAGQSDGGQVAGRIVVQLPRQAPAETEASVRITGMRFEELLPLLGTEEHWVTGALKLTGTVRGHGRNPHGVFPTLGGKATLLIEDGRIFKNDKRAIWKVLSILNLPAVLQGKVDLDKEGLPFNRLSATVSARNGLIESENIILDSPVLKITAAGNYDLATDQLDMVWAVSPFGSYSQFLKSIPLFGRLLAGERKGIATALFQVKGSIEDPEVTYLPMKSFASGLTGLAQLAFDVLKNTITLPVDLVSPDEKPPGSTEKAPPSEAPPGPAAP
ncbi:MAG: AsmA-like C-terminal domain-containing protein [Nitrospirota bacterium]